MTRSGRPHLPRRNNRETVTIAPAQRQMSGSHTFLMPHGVPPAARAHIRFLIVL